MGVGLEDGPQCKAGTWDPREASARSGPGGRGGHPAHEGRGSCEKVFKLLSCTGGCHSWGADSRLQEKNPAFVELTFENLPEFRD